MLKNYDKIVVIGASGAGKTTITRILSRLLNPDRFSFPPRFVSRNARQDDTPADNIALGHQKFDRIFSQCYISRWSKFIDSNRSEHYGFLTECKGTTNIYSCNDAIILHKETLCPSNFLDNACVVQVVVSDSIRFNRLINRSPELLGKPIELAVRMKNFDDVLKNDVHLRVTNDGSVPDDAAVQFAQKILGRYGFGTPPI